VVIGSAKFYFIRIDVLSKCLWLTLKSFNLRLWAITILFLVLWIIDLLLHILFRLIDEIFYSDYKKVQIKEPVFIIANPRSGTTFLHRILSMDGERFAYMKFAHTLFCSVSFIKFYNLLSRFHKAIGRPLKRVMNWTESKLFKGWKGVHNMGFSQAEEDEALFAQMMQSSGIFVLFPFLNRIKNTHCLDCESEIVRKNAMDFYESSLKRFMYATGSNKIYLAKNVNSTGRIQSILTKFPDARLIFIARNPINAVPSTASMFSAMYPLHSPALQKTDAEYREWCELSIAFYIHFDEVGKAFNQDKFLAVEYEDLVAEPIEIVERIYKQFHWNFTPEFREKLTLGIEKKRQYKSTNHYTLSQYGYSEKEIAERLNVIFEAFHFPYTSTPQQDSKNSVSSNEVIG